MNENKSVYCIYLCMNVENFLTFKNSKMNEIFK